MTPRFNRNEPFTVCRLPARVISAPLPAGSSCSSNSRLTGGAACCAATSVAVATSRPIGPRTIEQKVFLIDIAEETEMNFVAMASRLQQFPSHRDSVGDVIPRGAFADVHGQHSRKRTGARLEYLHGAPP